MDRCTNMISNDAINCFQTRPLTLEEKRLWMGREMWVKNVVRILGMDKSEAEDTWLRIQMANNND